MVGWSLSHCRGRCCAHLEGLRVIGRAGDGNVGISNTNFPQILISYEHTSTLARMHTRTHTHSHTVNRWNNSCMNPRALHPLATLYIRICVCIHRCVYAYMYYTCMYIHAVYTRMYIHVYTYIYVRTCVNAHTQIDVSLGCLPPNYHHTHACIHTHHTQNNPPFWHESFQSIYTHCFWTIRTHYRSRHMGCVYTQSESTWVSCVFAYYCYYYLVPTKSTKKHWFVDIYRIFSAKRMSHIHMLHNLSTVGIGLLV